MQPILIDLDGTCDFLFVVRIRGVLCEAVNPLHADMSVFDQRITRAGQACESDLRDAVGDLAKRLAAEMFRGCEAFERLIGSDAHAREPISRHEAIVLLCAFLSCAAKARGDDPTPFIDGSFSLIAEDDGVRNARMKLAASLPPGRTVGQPMPARPVEPQQGVAAAS